MSRLKAWQVLVSCCAYLLASLSWSLWTMKGELQAAMEAARISSGRPAGEDYMIGVALPAPWWHFWVVVVPPLLLVLLWTRERWRTRTRTRNSGM